MSVARSFDRQIGLSHVLNMVNTVTPYGEARKKARKVYRPGEEALLIQELDEIAFFIEHAGERSLDKIAFEFCRIKDIRRSVERLQQEHVLDEVELYELKIQTHAMEVIRREICDMHFGGISLHELKDVADLLDPQQTGLLTFHLYDEYLQELAELRRHKREVDQKLVQDPANEQILSERQSVIEQLEEALWQVRVELSDKLQRHAQFLLQNMDMVGKLDHLMAKATLARTLNQSKPHIVTEQVFALEQMFHPAVQEALQAGHQSMQRIDVVLYPGSTVLTGANMGGKSVTLKSLLLNIELMRHGYYVCAEQARLCLVDFLYYGAEDRQAIERGLSSFGMEVVEFKALMKAADQAVGLIVLDEPARGTNPLEGRAIVRGLLRYFQQKDSFFFIATHLPAVVEHGMRHLQIRGLNWQNRPLMHMRTEDAIRSLQQMMDYSLREVSAETAVPHEAIHVMQALGLDETITRDIKRLLGEEHE